MIWMVLATHVRRLMHNRGELLLMFVVPIIFFSVFAVIFGQGVGATPKIKVVVVDEIKSDRTHAIAADLIRNPGLRPMSEQPADQLNRQDAEQMVRRGGVSMAIVLCRHDTDTSKDAVNVSADLLSDASDQVAGQVVSAIVARTLALDAARHANPFTVANASASDEHPSGVVPAAYNQPAEVVDGAGPSSSGGQAAVRVVDVMGEGKANPVVSMYAAGIAVMFLLFGATTGGGVLLEEKESQTLDRLLSTNLTMDQLLLGKWFYLTIAGTLQVTVMFLWGQAVFGVDLLGHLDGFAMMTLVTASAAAAFGLLLATLCKTRGQLNALSVIVVLTMSALGGSMVPRYVMSPELRQAGLWTFNAWALDGYDKVFWRDLPVASLSPQLAVLMMSGFVFLVLARLLAMRWELQ